MGLEDGSVAGAAAAQIVVPPPAAPAEPAAGAAPWAKDLEERFADEAVRAQVDAYLREKQAPYVTKLEQERAQLRNELDEKSWVYDDLNGENSAEALERIAEALYPGTGARVAELVAAGATGAEAVEQAGAESGFELPPEVAETVEWAKGRKAADEAAEVAAAQAAAQEAAADELNKWLTPLLAAETDIIKGDLLAYVAASGDMTAAYAAYRENHPKPPADGSAPPPVLPGSAGSYQGEAPPRYGSVREAAGAVFDQAFGSPTR